MRKKNCAVLITAATKRIGLALTKQSLQMGFSVIAHYRSTASPLCRWLKKNPVYADKVHLIQYDLHHDPLLLLERCQALPVQLTGLVNNASVFTEGNLHQVDHLLDILAINTAVPLVLAQRFSSIVSQGWIINIVDADTGYSVRFQNYRISKLFLTELTRQQALTYGPALRVNAIAPGAILPSANNDRAFFQRLRETVPLRKTGDIPSLMKAYVYLVENNSVTGQVMYVDNGKHLYNQRY